MISLVALKAVFFSNCPAVRQHAVIYQVQTKFKAAGVFLIERRAGLNGLADILAGASQQIYPGVSLTNYFNKHVSTLSI